MEEDQKASSPDEEETITSDYQILHKLGQGSFAEVNLACHLPTNICVAIKKLKRGNDSVIKSEILALKAMDHPNIVRLYSIINTQEFTYLVIENAPGGTLLNHVLTAGTLAEAEAQRLFSQLVLAVAHCHAKGFAHRDIKPDNILLDKKNSIKLCDFGLSIQATPGKILKRCCGATFYCAPEMLDGQGYDPKMQDIWSLGIVLYFSVSGYLPFKGVTRSNLKEHILVTCRQKDLGLPSGLSSDIVNIIHTLLTVNPRLRPAIDDIKTHPWLTFGGKPAQPPCKDTPVDSAHHRISLLMSILGYSADTLTQALHDKTYDSVMAAYLILKHESPWGEHAEGQSASRFSSGVVRTLLGRPVSEGARPTLAISAKPHGQKATGDRQKHSCPDICAPQPDCAVPEVSGSAEPSSSLSGSNALPVDTSAPVSSSVPSESVTSSRLGDIEIETDDNYTEDASPRSQSPTNPGSAGSHQTTGSHQKASVVSKEMEITTKSSSSSPHKPHMSPRGSLEGESTRDAEEHKSASRHDPPPQAAGRVFIQNIYHGYRRLRSRIRRCFRSLCCCIKEERAVSRNQVAPVNGEENGATGSQG